MIVRDLDVFVGVRRLDGWTGGISESKELADNFTLTLRHAFSKELNFSWAGDLDPRFERAIISHREFEVVRLANQIGVPDAVGRLRATGFRFHVPEEMYREFVGFVSARRLVVGEPMSWLEHAGAVAGSELFPDEWFHQPGKSELRQMGSEYTAFFSEFRRHE
jgi:hypothetical protein